MPGSAQKMLHAIVLAWLSANGRTKAVNIKPLAKKLITRLGNLMENLIDLLYINS
jgi:hypothetical protein